MQFANKIALQQKNVCQRLTKNHVDYDNNHDSNISFQTIILFKH